MKPAAATQYSIALSHANRKQFDCPAEDPLNRRPENRNIYLMATRGQ